MANVANRNAPPDSLQTPYTKAGGDFPGVAEEPVSNLWFQMNLVGKDIADSADLDITDDSGTYIAMVKNSSTGAYLEGGIVFFAGTTPEKVGGTADFLVHASAITDTDCGFANNSGVLQFQNELGVTVDLYMGRIG